MMKLENVGVITASQQIVFLRAQFRGSTDNGLPDAKLQPRRIRSSVEALTGREVKVDRPFAPAHALMDNSAVGSP